MLGYTQRRNIYEVEIHTNWGYTDQGQIGKEHIWSGDKWGKDIHGVETYGKKHTWSEN